MKIRPQILVAMVILGVLGLTVVFVAPSHIVEIAGGVVTAIGMLGMKLLEEE